jgi:hypothetical protein
MDTLIMDLPWYEDHQDQMAEFKELSRIVYRDQEVVIIEIPRMDGNCRPEERGPEGS